MTTFVAPNLTRSDSQSVKYNNLFNGVKLQTRIAMLLRPPRGST